MADIFESCHKLAGSKDFSVGLKEMMTSGPSLKLTACMQGSETEEFAWKFKICNKKIKSVDVACETKLWSGGGFMSDHWGSHNKGYQFFCSFFLCSLNI